MMISRVWNLCCVLALAGSVCAQVWSPRAHYADEMGNGGQNVLGSAPLGRYQFVDGNFRNQVFGINGVTMRPHRTNQYPYAGLGRTWTNVTVDVGVVDMQNLSQTYSTNFLAPPTRSYSGSMSWPTLIGLPVDRSKLAAVTVPFTSSFLHQGAKDFALDFRMQGGVLANKGFWYLQSYATEGYEIRTEAFGIRRNHFDPNSKGCVDLDAAPPFQPAVGIMNLRRSGLTHWNQPVRGKVFLECYADRLGRSSPYVGVLDFAFNPIGIPVGVGCQRLYAALTPAVRFYAGSTDVSGRARTNFGIPQGLVDYHPSMHRLPVVTQFAWADTRSGQLKLSSAQSTVMPYLIESALDARRVCIWGTSLGPWGAATIEPRANPVFQYN